VFGSLPVNGLIGNYRSLWVGHARQPEIRSRAASGGVITQTLAYLLQEGRIEGAVVLCHGEPEPWLSRPRIATTVQQIMDSAQSVYVPVPVNQILGKWPNSKVA
jgi:coenzyme F420-reducing hydrogenase beta subunit